MIDSPSDHAVCEDIAVACRVLAREGLSRVSSGHVSSRTSDPSVIAIRGRSQSDTGLLYASPSDVVEVTFDGEVVGESEARPPRESHLHLEVLRLRPDVQSVVHVHPRWVVALRAAGLRLEPIYGAYDPEGLRLALGDIAYFPSSRLIDTPNSGRDVATALADKPACVLDGHGIVTVGDSIESAVLIALALDELAHVTCLAASMGKVEQISKDDQEALSNVVQTLRSAPATAAWQHWIERDRRGRQRGSGEES
jgi:ribulose-5-phosphate 4-epimerase/fuculose-1-phosphate aldolase